MCLAWSRETRILREGNINVEKDERERRKRGQTPMGAHQQVLWRHDEPAGRGE
jgi:hypothetical protein